MKEAMEALPPPKFWKEWKMQVRPRSPCDGAYYHSACRMFSLQVSNKYPSGIDRASGCSSISTLIVKEDREKLQQSQLMARRRQMAQEYGFGKRRKAPDYPIPLDMTHVAAMKQKRAAAAASELRAIIPPTHISNKYVNESSVVGVAEHYRRTFVNVTSKSDAQRRAEEINVETLLGLSASEKVSSVISDADAPHHLTLKVTHPKHRSDK